MAFLFFLCAACSLHSQEAPPASSTPQPTPTKSPTPAALTATATPSPKAIFEVPEGPPPAVDTTIASVPLEKVVFDTFGGPFVPLSEASSGTIETLRDAIKPIYQPRYDPAEKGDWLDDEDLVIGYQSQGGAFAYPLKILNFHEFVNDVIDGKPILVSYCPLCFSGVVWSREVDGQALLFGNTSALYESNVVMYDHQTGSYWFQTAGEAIVGPLTGKRLLMLPSMTTTWREWKELHSDTLILSKDLELLIGSNPYDYNLFQGYEKTINSNRFAFPVTKEKLDPRLPPGEDVITIRVGESNGAYPVSRLGSTAINDELGGEPIAVFILEEENSAAAFFRMIDEQELTFQLRDGLFQDQETGSIWDLAGEAISGPFKGRRLVPVPSLRSYWFSAVTAFPNLELYAP